MEKELNRLSELALALAKSRGFESVSLYVNSHWNGYVVFEANPLPMAFADDKGLFDFNLNNDGIR